MTGNGAPVRNRYHPYYSLQRWYNCLRKHRHLFLLKTAGAAATLYSRLGKTVIRLNEFSCLIIIHPCGPRGAGGQR